MSSDHTTGTDLDTDLEDIRELLFGLPFPAHQDDVLATLTHRHAPSRLLWRVGGLPRTEPYQSLDQLCHDVAGSNSPDAGASGARSAAVPSVHNSAVDETAAQLGGCGQVHLPSGRMCTLRNGHEGSCEFTPAEDVDIVLADHKAAGGW